MKIDTNSASVFDLKISPDQTSVACGLIEAPLKVFRLEDGAEILSIKDRNYDSAWAVDWKVIDDETYLFAGYGDNGYLRIFNSQGSNVLRYTTRSRDYGYPNAAQLHTNSIRKIEVSGDFLLSVSEDGSLVKLKLEKDADEFNYNRKLEKRLRFSGKSLAEALVWDPETAFITNSDGEILQVDLNKMKVIKSLAGHSEKVVSLAKFNEKYLLSLAADQVKIWDLEKNEVIKEKKPESAGYKIAAFGQQIIHTEGNLIVVRDENLEKIDEYETHQSIVRTFDISADGKYLVSGDDEGIICMTKINL